MPEKSGTINLIWKMNMVHQASQWNSPCSYGYLLAMLMLIVNHNLQAQYYVSPAGSDNNSGTLQLPFKTIQKAAGIMVAGDTCYIMNGKYRETVSPANNGTTDNPIVFTNYNEERVVILGSDSVSGWYPYQNGIYKAYVPDSVVQLFANKQRAYPARYPDNLDGNMYDASRWNPIVAEADGDAFFYGMNKAENYWVGGYCKIFTGNKWVAHIGKISSSDGDMVHCDERSIPWNDKDPETILGPGMGYIIKHLHALDKVNEWHWQNDTLYYFPESDANIDTMKIEARTRLYGFDCMGKSYIEISNIHFVWASVNFGAATACVLDGGSVWFPAPFFNYNNSWGRFQGIGPTFSIWYWKGKGIYVSGTGNTVKNCYVGYSWGDGISVGGINNRVENCLVEHTDWSATDASAIAITGVGHTIIGNTLRSSARSILLHRFCKAATLNFNNLYDSGLLCDDLGLTYAPGTDGEETEIAYNWVHDNNAVGNAAGIYLDSGDTNFVVHHNVIWNCEYAIQTNKPAVNNEFYNNTAWYCNNAQYSWGTNDTLIVNQQVINNLSDKDWDIGTFFQTNLTTNNPMFVDPDNGDFRLLENSPAIDYGTHIPGITDGYIGTAPDAGAYEYGGEDWVAGSDIEIPDLSDIFIIPEIIPQDLVAWYPFNGNALDESGNGYHASEIIGATLTDDKDGNPNSAYAFDGIDDKIIIPQIGVNLANDFTITYWFQPNDLTTGQWLFGNRRTLTGKDGYGLQSHILEDETTFFWPDHVALSFDLLSNDWQFVVFTKENDLYSLFYNGEIVDSGISAHHPASSNTWRIGALFNQQGWSAHFNGKMDDIRVYGRALSLDEIEDLYNGNPIGIYNNKNNDDEIMIYPNPSSSKFHFIGLGKKACNFEVYNSAGRKILDKTGTKTIDLSANPNGIYLVVFFDENNQILSSKKIIKN